MRLLWKHTGSAYSPDPSKWNIIITRYGGGGKTIQGIENINLFAEKGLLYYITLEWSKWGESDVKGSILVLQRHPLQIFIA